MNKFAEILYKLAGKLILSKKDQIIANMNKKLDLPLMTEEDERKLLEWIWELVESSVADALNKK